VSEPLQFKEINLRRMPGFQPPGFTVEDLCEGITVLHGPNASGKTTLAGAIGAVLWPDHAPDGAEVRAQALIGNDEYIFDLQDSTARYQKNGVSTDRPLLPPSQTRDRAVLTLPELLRKTESDEALAKAVFEESTAGYNPRESASNLEFKQVRPRTGEATKSLEKAMARLDKRQRRAQETRTKEDTLTTLRKRREKADQAREEVNLLQEAKKHAEKRSQERDAEEALGEFPSELENFDGNELERLKEIDEHIDDALDDEIGAQEKIEKGERDLEDADLPEGGVDEKELDTLDNHLERAQDRQEDVAAFEQEIKEAKEKRREAEERLDGEVDRDKLSEIGPREIQDLEKLIRQVGEIEAKREALDAREVVIGEHGETPDPNALRSGLTHLSGWLRTGGPGPVQDQQVQPTALVAALFIAGLSVFIGWMGNWAVGALGIGLAVLVPALSLWQRDEQEGRDGRELHRKEYERLDLDAPSSWDPESISSRIEELSDELSEAKERADAEERLEEIERQRTELTEHEENLEAERNDLSDRLGVDIAGTKGELRWISEALSTWREANASVESLQQKTAKTEEQRDEVLGTLDTGLSPYDYDRAESVEEASSNLDDLHARATKHDNAQSVLEDQGPRRQKAIERLDKWARKRKDFFHERDLDPGSDERLSELAGQFETYDDARSKLKGLQTERQQLAEQLRDHDAFDEEVLTASQEALDRRIESLQPKAERWKEHNDKIQAIKTKIEERKDERDIEEALADVDRARRTLEAELEDHQAADVGDLIANHVHEETRDSELPSVFRDARDILLKVSRRRYRLEFDDRKDPPEFLAFDSEDGIGKEFHELSDGTKVQLLLSVRLAFLGRQEQGAKVPLILDETLANADEARALAIIQTATELARSGRQVLYLTAQRDEVAKWQTALRDEEVPFETVDFGDVTATSHDGDALNIEFPGLRVEVPVPDGKDHGEYGRALGVPPIDPLEYYGKAHAWYVVEDPELLQATLERGIRAVGPLESLLDAGAQEDLIPEEETAQRIQARIDALKALIEAARIGRGRPVDRSVLEESGAVSDVFIDEVSQMARDVDGDAGSLVQVLEDDDRKPNRWQQNKTEELREFLETEGYLDPLDRLDADQLQARVLSDVSDWIERDVLSMEDVQRLIARADGPG
jgi:DNA repair exonuclease SbcCD ATPase subunit